MLTTHANLGRYMAPDGTLIVFCGAVVVLYGCDCGMVIYGSLMVVYGTLIVKWYCDCNIWYCDDVI